MWVIPAIDLKEGRCVRLTQGDVTRMTVYSNDPVELAEYWEKAGAPMLHFVDLDGALTGRPQNISTLARILPKISIPVQWGGGIRNLPHLEELLSRGVHRVVLGTAAVKNKTFLQQACAKHADGICVSIDARDNKVVLEGWKQVSRKNALSVAEEMIHHGVKTILYTDILREGTLSGPNWDGIRQMSRLPVSLLISGGISSYEDIKTLQDMGGVEGVIVGKAFYTGKMNLSAALALPGVEKLQYSLHGKQTL